MGSMGTNAQERSSGSQAIDLLLSLAQLFPRGFKRLRMRPLSQSDDLVAVEEFKSAGLHLGMGDKPNSVVLERLVTPRSLTLPMHVREAAQLRPIRIVKIRFAAREGELKHSIKRSVVELRQGKNQHMYACLLLVVRGHLHRKAPWIPKTLQIR